MDKLEVYGFDFRIEGGKIFPEFPHRDIEQFLNLIPFEKLTIAEARNKIEGIARFLQFKNGRFFISDQDKNAVAGMISEKRKMLLVNLDNLDYISGDLQCIHHRYWLMGFVIIDWSKASGLTEYTEYLKHKLISDWQYLTAIAFIPDDNTCGVISSQNDTIGLNWHQSEKNQCRFLPPNPGIVKILCEETLLCFLDPNFKIPPEHYHRLQISLDNCIIIGNNETDRRLSERAGVKFLDINQINNLNESAY